MQETLASDTASADRREILDTPPTTPWGEIEYVKEHCPGVLAFGTIGHGGFWLSKSKLAEMPDLLRQGAAFNFTKDPQWFEEDVDSVLVILAFPQLFNDSTIANACRMAIHYNEGRAFNPYMPMVFAKRWLATPQARPVIEAAARNAEECKARAAALHHTEPRGTRAVREWKGDVE